MKILLFITKNMKKLLDLKLSNILFMALISLFLTIANFTHGYIGTFSRYVADDYCTAAKLSTMGFWQAQSFWFNNWTGRYTFTFFISFFELFGSTITSYIPYILIILLYGSSFIFFLSIFKKIRVSNNIFFAFFLTSIFIFMILFTIPNIGQNLYWMTGSTTYFLPIIFFFLVSSFLIEIEYNASKKILINIFLYALVVIGTFIVSGFSEVLSVLQILIFGLLFAYIIFSKKKIIVNKPLLFGLVGSIIGLFVMVSAPGNQIRLSNHLPHPEFLTLLTYSFVLSSKFTILWFIKQIHIIWPVCSILIIFSAFQNYGETFMIYFDNKKNIFISFLLFSSFFLVYVSFIPSIWATANPPVSRVMIFPVVILTLMCLSFSIIVGVYLQELFVNSINSKQLLIIFISSIFVYFLISTPIYQAKINYSRRAEAKTFAIRWDARENKIKDQIENGNYTLFFEIIPINISDVEHIQPNPNHWINICAAEYYGVQEITAE